MTPTPPPLLLLTIDVEEDMPGWVVQEPLSVANVQALLRLAELCRDLGVRPTYLCTYPVATRPESRAVLRELSERGDCEIGSHLHAWNTPPFAGVPGRAGDERRVAYFQFELGRERFRSKLETLHAAVASVTATPPVSFRAGRFGIDAATLEELCAFGYLVDSSVTPLDTHVHLGGPDFRGAPQEPYHPSRRDVTRRGSLPILEIPVSVGPTRRLPAFVQRALVRLPARAHVRGLLSRDFLNLVEFAWLYPPRFELDPMRRTAGALVRSGVPMLNVFLHSSELQPGASGRADTPEQVEASFQRLRLLLEHLIEHHGARPATLAEAAKELSPRATAGAA